MQQFNQAPVPLDIGSTKTDLTVVAEAYSPPYNIGEYCSRDGKIYKCKSAVSSGAAWYASNWDEVVIADEIHNGNIRKVDITFTNIDVQTENELYGDTSYVDVSGYNFNEVNALFFEVTAPTKIDAITLTFNGDRVTASATFYYGCPSSVTLSIYVAPIPGLSSSHTQTLHGATGAVFYGLNQKVAKSDIYNGLDQTTAGKVLDARAGSSLNQAITNLGNKLVREKLTSGDFDSLTVSMGAENKYYYGSDVSALSHYPTGESGSFSLDVKDMGSYSVQVLTIYDTQTIRIYQRQQYWGGSKLWGSWQQYALKSDIAKSKTEFFGAYPNGHLYNQTYFLITAPCWNPDLSNITVNNAYVYNSSGSFQDIKSSVSIDVIGRASVVFKITHNASYANYLLRIEFAIA